VVCGTNGPVRIGFQGCRFDAGVTSNGLFGYPDLTEIALRHCEVFGAASLLAQLLNADSSTFHGPLWLNASDATFVRDNRLEDIHGTAITVFSREALIAGNLIRRGTAGIHAVTDEGDIHVQDNRVEGCLSDGIVANPGLSGDRSYLERNVVSHCGGVGIRATNLKLARGNRVLGCSGIGLDLHHFEDPAVVEANVVGRCGSHGIEVTHDYSGSPGVVSIHDNTVYACRGTGIVLTDLAEGSLSRNISCFNVGAGLEVFRTVVPSLSCNDWYANEAGAPPRFSPSPTDRFVDPIFCDLANDDVQLRSDSPLLDAPGCGRIGALGQGCEPPVEITFRFTPSTFHVAAHGRWVTGELEPRAPFSVDAIDVASIRLNGVPVDAAAPIGPGDRGRSSHRTLIVRFDRDAISRTLTHGDAVPVVVTGTIGDRTFRGADVIRVLRGTGPIAVDLSHESAAVEIPPALSVRVSSLHPAAGGRLSIEFTLPDQSPARLELLDVAGRVMMSRQVGELGRGQHTLELAPERALPQGIYFVRLRRGADEARSRAAVIR